MMWQYNIYIYLLINGQRLLFKVHWLMLLKSENQKRKTTGCECLETQPRAAELLWRKILSWALHQNLCSVLPALILGNPRRAALASPTLTTWMNFYLLLLLSHCQHEAQTYYTYSSMDCKEHERRKEGRLQSEVEEQEKAEQWSMCSK